MTTTLSVKFTVEGPDQQKVVNEITATKDIFEQSLNGETEQWRRDQLFIFKTDNGYKAKITYRKKIPE